MTLPRRESLETAESTAKRIRRRLPLKGEFLLALLPTVTILAVLALVEGVSRQRLLFASLVWPWGSPPCSYCCSAPPCGRSDACHSCGASDRRARVAGLWWEGGTRRKV